MKSVKFFISAFFLFSALTSWSSGERKVKPLETRILCTSTANDSNLINSIIGKSHAGDKIVFHGSCLLNSTIKLLGNRSYNGESRTGTVLKQMNGANLVALFASDTFLDDNSWTGNPISIRQLTLDGNSANNSSPTNGLVLRSWQSVVEDVQITNVGGNGIFLTNLTTHKTALSNTQVNGRIVGNFIKSCGANGIYVQDTGNSVTDWTLTDNWIGHVGQDGIHLENTAGWMVERNHLYGISQNGITANRSWAASISDNYIEDFGQSSSNGTWYGIKTTLQGGTASTISHNRIFNTTGEKNSSSEYVYLGITGVNSGVGLASVVGNTILGVGSSHSVGLLYQKLNGSELIVTSTGNIVHSVGTTLRHSDGAVVSAGL